MISNIQGHTHGYQTQHAQQEQRGHQLIQEQQHQQREEQRRLQQEQEQQQQRERQRRRRERNQRRYEQWQERVYQRQQDRYRREQAERDHEEYLRQRSPTFDEGMDEILGERELEEYYLQGMTPQERQEIWERDHLNELQGNPVRRPHGLPLDNVKRYAEFLQDQQSWDEHHQAMRIYDRQNRDYREKCRRNNELLMQKEEREDMAFRLQQFE